MVSGSTTADASFFERYYRAKLDEYMARGCSFLVGGARGIDRMTQEYLLQRGYDSTKITVVDKGEQDNRVCSTVQHRNGFESYPKRDAWMTRHSDVDLAVVRQYGGGGSGTFANIVRRETDDKTARRIQKLFRKHAEEYEHPQ